MYHHDVVLGYAMSNVDLPLTQQQRQLSSPIQVTRSRIFLTAVFERYRSAKGHGRLWVHVAGIYYILMAIFMVTTIQFLVNIGSTVVGALTIIVHSSWLLAELYIFEGRSLLYTDTLVGLVLKLWISYYYYAGCQSSNNNNNNNGIATDPSSSSSSFHEFLREFCMGGSGTWNAYYYTETAIACVLFLITALTYLRCVLQRPMLVKFFFFISLLLAFTLMSFARVASGSSSSGYLSHAISVTCLILSAQMQIVHASKTTPRQAQTLYDQVHSFVYIIRTLWPLVFVNSSVICWYFAATLVTTYISCGQIDAEYRLQQQVRLLFDSKQQQQQQQQPPHLTIKPQQQQQQQQQLIPVPITTTTTTTGKRKKKHHKKQQRTTASTSDGFNVSYEYDNDAATNNNDDNNDNNDNEDNENDSNNTRVVAVYEQ